MNYRKKFLPIQASAISPQERRVSLINEVCSPKMICRDDVQLPVEKEEKKHRILQYRSVSQHNH